MTASRPAASRLALNASPLARTAMSSLSFETPIPNNDRSIFTLPCATGLALRPPPAIPAGFAQAAVRVQWNGRRRAKLRNGLIRQRTSRSPVCHRWRYTITNGTLKVTRTIKSQILKLGEQIAQLHEQSERRCLAYRDSRYRQAYGGDDRGQSAGSPCVQTGPGFSGWPGVTAGGKEKPGAIIKKGNAYISRLPVLGGAITKRLRRGHQTLTVTCFGSSTRHRSLT